jgi:hypothetical protein
MKSTNYGTPNYTDSPALSYFLFSDSNSTLPVTKITQSVVNSSEHTYISKVRSFPSLQATYNTYNYQALEFNVRITRPLSRSYTNLQENTTTLFPEHVLKALSDVVVHLRVQRDFRSMFQRSPRN